MILYDNVCTPCVRKQEWRHLLRYARINKLDLRRVDLRKQPQYLKDMWWDASAIPLPVLEYEAAGERFAVNLTEFLRLNAKEDA